MGDKYRQCVRTAASSSCPRVAAPGSPDGIHGVLARALRRVALPRHRALPLAAEESRDPKRYMPTGTCSGSSPWLVLASRARLQRVHRPARGASQPRASPSSWFPARSTHQASPISSRGGDSGLVGSFHASCSPLAGDLFGWRARFFPAGLSRAPMRAHNAASALMRARGSRPQPSSSVIWACTARKRRAFIARHC